MTFLKIILSDAHESGAHNSGGDFLSTSDGSEISDRELNALGPVTTQKGDGSGAVPDWGQANHTGSPDGQNTHDEMFHFDRVDADEGPAQNQAVERLEGRKSNNVQMNQLGDEMVDDNHADGMASHFAALNYPEEAGGSGADFTKHPADSPQVLQDGHPLEELERQEGAGGVSVNNPMPAPMQEVDSSMLSSPSSFKKKLDDNTPEFNKGRNVLCSTAISAIPKSAAEIRNDIDPAMENYLKKREELYGSESNVPDIVNPDENRLVHDKARRDFGSGDKLSDNQTESSAPFSGNRGYDNDSDAQNWSGRANASLLRIIKTSVKMENIVPAEPHELLPEEHVNPEEAFQRHTDPKYVEPRYQLSKDKSPIDPGNIDAIVTPRHGKPFQRFEEERNFGVPKAPVEPSNMEMHLFNSQKNSLLKVLATKEPCGKCHRTDYNDIRGRLCDGCAFKDKKAQQLQDVLSQTTLAKEAYSQSLPPSLNPNSGKDNEDQTGSMETNDFQPGKMSDGVNASNYSNEAEKAEFDASSKWMKRLPRYMRTQNIDNQGGDSPEHYMDTLNSGGGFGMEGSPGMFSGVAH